MRLRLVPREESFFDLFEDMPRKVQQGASFGLLALAFLRQRRERGDAIALAAS